MAIQFNLGKMNWIQRKEYWKKNNREKQKLFSILGQALI